MQKYKTQVKIQLIHKKSYKDYKYMENASIEYEAIIIYDK